MVEIIDETHHFQHAERLGEVVRALLTQEAMDHRELTIVLMRDEEIAIRNRADRGSSGPTDVLSYPTWEPDDVGVPQVGHLGDILISVETAARQAAENGHEVLDEVVVLAAHGFTHLRGFDHRTEEEWVIFRETQDRALALLRAS